MLRVVLDTNILVSGLLYSGRPRKLMDLAVEGRIEVVSSPEMIDELRRVLSRDKFGLAKEEQKSMMDFVIRLSRIIFVRSRFKVATDAGDDIVVNAAYDGEAAYIVSGDKELLELKQFGKIKIVRVSEMLRVLERVRD